MTDETATPAPTVQRGLAATDILGAVGLLLLTIGSGMIYLPAGFIVPGAALLVGAVMGARRR